MNDITRKEGASDFVTHVHKALGIGAGQMGGGGQKSPKLSDFKYE